MAQSQVSVQLSITADTLAKLVALRSRPKYVDEPGTIYNGMRPESGRQLAQKQLNDLIDLLQRDLPSTPTKEFVLSQFSTTLAQFEPADSEDRDRLCSYLEEIMDIVGIESSDGLLNLWRYGFDPTKLVN